MAGEEVMNNAGFSYLGINKMPAALTENEDEICLSSSTYACNAQSREEDVVSVSVRM